MPEYAGDLRGANWAMLCRAVQRTPDETLAMALPDTMHLSARYVSRDDFQYCSECVEKTPDLVLRHWRFSWSLTCEACGRVLAAKYPKVAVSGRLFARADRGAEALKSTVTTNNPARLRRVDLTLHFLAALEIGNLGSLTSGNGRERLMALAAVGVSVTRPIVGAILILRGNDWAVRVLRRAFPQHRRVIERMLALSHDLDRRLPGRRETEHLPEQEEHRTSKSRASESALRAAQQAIAELGSGADRQALLARADAIWRCSDAVKS